MLIMQISTQTGNHKYSEKVTTKKIHSGSEVSKHSIQQITQNSIYFLFIKTKALVNKELEINKAILEHVKVAE